MFERSNQLFVLNFTAFAIFLENSTMYQAATLYTELGFDHLKTTLLMVVQNSFGTFSAICGTIALSIYRKRSCFVAAASLMPSLSVAISLPWSIKPGSLGRMFLTRTIGTAHIFVWFVSQTTAAHKNVDQNTSFYDCLLYK